MSIPPVEATPIEDGVPAPEPGSGRRKATLSGRIAANSVAQIVGNGLASFISLFTFAAMTRALGPSSFGDYAAAAAFLGIPLLLGDLGLSWTVLREISKRPERRDHVMGVSIVVRWIAAAAILTAAVALALMLPFNSQTHYAIAVGALGTFCNLADLSLMPALQAELRMVRVVLMTVVSRLITLGLVLGMVAADMGFHAIVWAYVIGSAANLLLDILVVRSLVGFRLIVDVPYGWALLRGSLTVGVAYATGTAYWYADRVLLALLGTSRDVGLYGAAFKYVELSFIPISAISLSIFPVLARAIGNDETARVPHLLQWSVDIMLLASVPVCAFTLVQSDFLIHVVGGDDFAPAASALQVLGFLIVAFFVSSAFERALIAGHKERLLGQLNGGILVFNIALNVALIPAYGYIGVAVVSLATSVAWLLVAAIFARRFFGFTPRLGFAGVVVLAGAAMAVICAMFPGPPAIGVALGLLAYMVIVTVPPGAGREAASRILRDVRGVRASAVGP